jgi:hypothetical protein
MNEPMEWIVRRKAMPGAVKSMEKVFAGRPPGEVVYKHGLVRKPGMAVGRPATVFWNTKHHLPVVILWEEP